MSAQTLGVLLFKNGGGPHAPSRLHHFRLNVWGEQKDGFQKGGFGGCSLDPQTRQIGTTVPKPERGYKKTEQFRTGTKNRNEGTFAKTTLFSRESLNGGLRYLSTFSAIAYDRRHLAMKVPLTKGAQRATKVQLCCRRLCKLHRVAFGPPFESPHLLLRKFSFTLPRDLALKNGGDFW